MKYTTLRLDLAKSMFHYVVINTNNKIIAKGKLRRNQLLEKLSNLEVDPISVEASASSHYWGHKLQKLDILPFVKPDCGFATSQSLPCSSGIGIQDSQNHLNFFRHLFENRSFLEDTL